MIRKKKSIAFWIVVVCLTLIFVSMFLSLIWQEGFTSGIARITVKGGSVGFNLWKLVMVAVLLIIQLRVAIRSRRKWPEVVWTGVIGCLCSAAVFYLIDRSVYGWTSYPPLSSLGHAQLTYDDLQTRLWFVKGLSAVLALLAMWRIIQKRPIVRDRAIMQSNSC